MAPRRFVAPPHPQLSPRASLDASLYPRVDTVLKQLRTHARRLQTVLSLHRDELQILERLYYKGKNQHRTALFWQRVAEIRRYGERLESMAMYDIVESLRLSFWGNASQRNPKILKGPWTYIPDVKSVSFVLERCSACCTLVDKAQERLCAAYHSFTLMMQTGAFLQLILTLAAIASRLSVLLTDVGTSMQLCWQTALDLLRILDPKQAQSIKPLLAEDTASRKHLERLEDVDTNDIPKVSYVAEEDLGSTLQRPLQADPSLSMDVGIASSSVTPELDDLNMISVATPAATSIQTTIERKAVGTASVTKSSGTKRKDTAEKAAKPKKKKKKDEIDDIFGF